MIAPIRNTVTQSSTQVTSSLTQVAPPFESFLPTLKIQFRKAAAALPTRTDRTDAVAEMVGMAYRSYASLVRRGRTDIFSTPLGDFAIKSYFSGRRVAGMSATDITSDRCQLLGRSTVSNDVCDYVCKKTNDPAVLGAFRVDFKDWWQTLDARTQNILHSILYGYTTNEIADQFKVSPGRISQLRRVLVDSWNEFVAERSNDDDEDES